MARDSVPGVFFHDFSAGGETGTLIREKDWSATALGPRASWPRSLENHLSMVFELPTAAIIFWGPEQIQLYNDGYSVIMGPRHPRHLGSTFRECWPEAYPTIHPWMRRVLENGETVEVVQTLVPLTRFGFEEEAYFTFSFSPLRDDAGKIAGVLQLVTEVTELVLGDRRSKALRDLANQTVHAKTIEEAAARSIEVLGKYTADLPFSAIYVVDDTGSRKLVLCGSTGENLPAELDLESETNSPLPEVARVVRTPIFAADQQTVVAVLVTGTSPRLSLDDRYRDFLQLISTQIGAVMAAARAYAEERKRAEALAEIDRAKTAFFDNVSHELRTPLTLILGPLDDALREPTQALRGDALEAVHRNALRLLRLVNSLLEFSRAESGRQTQAFAPVDLSTLTAGLAGSFQSLVEGAGLSLVVDCPALPKSVYVDRSHWEKIVLNLVSNAFKFTFQGAIVVRLGWYEDHVELTVKDTGTGIPAAELPRIFERFRRLEGARGRSFEGTGIGLSLVQELVRLHGGSVKAKSVEGEGTTMTVSIPTGFDHLPKERVLQTHSHGSEGANTDAYLLEAAHWSPSASNGEESAATVRDGQTRILVADDNADMQRYLERLLEPHWSVTVVNNGQEALASARARAPDLILSDVMMPVMDGLTLVRELRADAKTSSIPIVLLSARAGQEAVVGGLDTGADDYLVKPFSALELMSRVRTLLYLVRLRKEGKAAAEELAATRATLIEELETRNRELEEALRDLRAAQSQLVQAAKMASLGELVAGVAHEVNNPLAFAINHVDTVSRLLDQIAAGLGAGALDSEKQRWDRALARLGELHGGLARIGDLVLKLRTFSRLDEGELRLVSMRESVDSILTILRHRVEAGVEIVTDFGASDRVVCYAALLNQAIMNLVSNAIDAVGETGRIKISTRESGSSYLISVEDDGPGIPEAIRERVLEPFFTTKAVGKGMGLGLSITYSIVKTHKGELTLSTPPQGGTLAEIRLPLHPE